MTHKKISHIISVAFWVMISGCASINVLKTADILVINKEVEAYPYKLGPGDTIAVKLFYNEEFNDEVIIRPDGAISLQPIGDINVAGMTLDELDDVLTKKYIEVMNVPGGGDKIDVRIWIGDNEIHDQAIVNNEGRIYLDTLQDAVDAAGLSMSQIHEVLKDKYSRIGHVEDLEVSLDNMKQPEVTVILRDSAAQRVYVGGQVHTPRMVPIVGTLRAADAIYQAGGPVDSAALDQVVLIRHGHSGDVIAYALDMKDIMIGKVPDVRLQPYDVIYVPRTAIAKLNFFVKQYIHNLIPLQFGFIYNVNPEVKVVD